MEQIRRINNLSLASDTQRWTTSIIIQGILSCGDGSTEEAPYYITR